MASRWRLVLQALAVSCFSACGLLTDLSDYAGPPAVEGDAAVTPPAPDASPDAPVVDKRDASPQDASDAALDDPYARAVRQDAPLAYFRLEEATGTACKDEIGGAITAVYPASGATRQATGINAASRGLHLDAVDSVLSVFGTSALSGKQPFTVELWIQLDAAPVDTARVFFNQDGFGAARTGQLAFFEPTGQLHTETWASGSLLFYTRTTTPLPSSAFVHVAYGYSDVEGRDFLYVDGVRGEGARTGPGDHVAPTSSFQFGGSVGTVDEIAFYDSVLSPARVAAHYAAR